MTTATLSEFVKKYGNLLPEVLLQAVDPVYDFDLEKTLGPEGLKYLQGLGADMPLRLFTADGGVKEWRGPLPGQQHVIAAILASLREGNNRFILRGETGVGKTQIALMALEMARREGMNMSPILVTEPRRVTKQWRERIKAIVPNAVTMTVARPEDVEVFSGLARVYQGRKMVFGMIPNSMISRGPGFRPVGRMVGVKPSKDPDGLWQPTSIFTKHNGHMLVGCPTCYLPIGDIEFEDLREVKTSLHTMAELQAVIDRGVRLFCPKCGGALFEEVRPVPPGKDVTARNVTFDVGEYIIKNWKRLSRQAGGPIARTMIVDELHQVFSMGSIRGATVMNLSRKVDNLLGLGASIYSGKASSIFWIYFMFFPEEWPKWGNLDQAYERWIEELSNEAIIEKHKLNMKGAGQKSQATKQVLQVNRTKRELPSAPPRLVRMLAPRTIHIKLEQLGIEMPPLALGGIKIKLDPDHQLAYQALIDEALSKAKEKNRYASAYLQAALTYAIAPWMEMEVGDVVPKQFPASYICAPERALLDFVEAEKNQGRKTIVYVTHTDVRDIVPRLISIMDNRGIAACRIPAALPREDIPSWLHNEAAIGDVVILQEKSIEGVDAIKFQNAIFFELDYSVWPVQQAAGRHWRLGQTQGCRTIFMEIEKTMLMRVLGMVMESICAVSQIYGDDVDTQVSKFSRGTLIQEAMRQELAGSALPDIEALYKRTHEAITKGVASDERPGSETDDA